jgi:hypothetical protein
LEPQHVFLITSAQEGVRLPDWVSPEALQKLAQLDYQRYFVIAVFRGSFPDGGYDAVIQRVVRRGDGLVVEAQFWAPSPYYAVEAMSTDPYHVIMVVRDGGPLEAAKLVLKTEALTPTPPPEIRRLTATPPR